MRVSRLLAVLIFLPALAMAQTAPTPAAPPATTAPATTPPAATPSTTTPSTTTSPATTSPTTTPPVAAPSTDATPVAPPAASTETVPVASPTAPPAPTVAAALPRDLSVLGMFLAADWVVQAVMIGLVVASVLTWTVFLAKSLELAAAQRRQTRALAAIDSAPSLDAAPANDLVAVALVERKLSVDNNNDRDGLKERIASRLERLEAATGRRMLKGTGVLATIGATAPFVGLFGTVWGIMNSFIGISKSQTTNLAVVAPGIAEALLATALGLAAAIPAVVIYNHFSRRIAAYRALVGDTSAAVLRLVSRDIGKSGAK